MAGVPLSQPPMANTLPPTFQTWEPPHWTTCVVAGQGAAERIELIVGHAGLISSSCASAARVPQSWRARRLDARRAEHLPLRPQQPALLPVPVALLLGFALVVQLLALGQRDLQLRAALGVEVHLERHEGHALARDRVVSWTISRVCSSSLRRRRGSCWKKRPTVVNSGM